MSLRDNEMNKVCALIGTPSIWVKCPNDRCDREFDIFDDNDSPETSDSSDGVSPAWKILTEWIKNKDLQPIKAECPCCDERFLIDRLEY